MVGAPKRRAAVRYLREKKGFSQRRACRLVRLPRASARYVPRRAAQQEAQLVERLKKIKKRNSRLGYRMATQLVRRETGQPINHKRVYRLWKREDLVVKRRTKKKRRTGPKQERAITATRADAVWCVDFVEDQSVSGRKLRLLTVTDEFTRESLAIEVGTSMPATKVAAVLERVMAERGVAPLSLRSDNGPEFIAAALRGFLYRSGVATAYIEPGKPWQNGFAESFHSRFRDEFLSQEVFLSVLDCQVRVRVWQRWYNEERPHSSLGYRTPREFASRFSVGQDQVAETNIPAGT